MTIQCFLILQSLSRYKFIQFNLEAWDQYGMSNKAQPYTSIQDSWFDGFMDDLLQVSEIKKKLFFNTDSLNSKKTKSIKKQLKQKVRKLEHTCSLSWLLSRLSIKSGNNIWWYQSVSARHLGGTKMKWNVIFFHSF